MSTTQARLFENWAAAWSSGDPTRLLQLVTEDCYYEDVTLEVVNRGTEEVRAFAVAVFAAIPDFKMAFDTTLVADVRAAGGWVMSGTYEGDFPGLPRTGRTFSVRGASIIERRDDKVARISDYWDMSTLQTQLGLAPTEPVAHSRELHSAPARTD